MQEQEPKKASLTECLRGQKRRLPVRWRSELFPVAVRHRCLKIPRLRFVRVLRQQVTRG
jgi:hypothetical protein